MREALVTVLALALLAPGAAASHLVPEVPLPLGPMGTYYVVLAPPLVPCDDGAPECVPCGTAGCSFHVDEELGDVHVDVTLEGGLRPDHHAFGVVFWEETNGCPGLQEFAADCPGDEPKADRHAFAWHPLP